MEDIFLTEIPKGKFRELQSHDITKKIKTIPLKDWLVVLVVLILLSMTTSGLVVLVEVIKRVMKKDKSVFNVVLKFGCS